MSGSRRLEHEGCLEIANKVGQKKIKNINLTGCYYLMPKTVKVSVLLFRSPF
jgi:hypothetical protein